MTQILSGKKLAFQHFELHQIALPARNGISIDMVLNIVKLSPGAMKYLPDEPEKYVTRPYLFNIVNSIDPSFFKRLEEELFAKQLLKRKEKNEPTIQVKREMFDLIKQFSAMSAVQSNGRSLASAKPGAKKRKRA